MSRYFKKQKPPKAATADIPAHTPAQSHCPTRLFVTRIHDGRCEQKEAESAADCAPRQGDDFIWVCVQGMAHASQIEEICNLFRIHHLNIEDILNTDHITKLDIFDEYTFLIMKSMTRPAEGDPHARQLSFVLGKDFLLSFLEGEEDLFLPLRKRMLKEFPFFMAMGTGYLAYSLMDMAVDRHFEVLEYIDDEIYKLEEETTTTSTQENLGRIQTLRRKVIMVRRAAWPLRDVINTLHRRDNFIRGEKTGIYLNDIYDHVLQVVDTTETFREVLSNIFDIYLTSAGNRTNEIMKVLTMIATIVMPMTVITGIYGMNFKHMPELRWIFGYPMSLTLLVLVGAGMLWYFKKHDWL